MSIDTKGITRGRVDYNDLYNFIKQNFDSEATCDISFNERYNLNMGSIDFYYKTEGRCMYVTEIEYDDEHPDIEIEKGSLWMKLKMWGSSIEIMNTIMKHFGGYVDESDCDDIGWIEYRK